MIEVKYEVAVQVDPDLWNLNYQTGDATETSSDIQTYMGTVIEELVTDYLNRTGNRGHAKAASLCK